MTPMWDLATGLKLYRDLLPFALEAGFSLGLTGGVLRGGDSSHDIDVIVYPLQSNRVDVPAFKRVLEAIGFVCVKDRETVTAGWRRQDKLDEKWVEIWSDPVGRRVDFFFLG